MMTEYLCPNYQSLPRRRIVRNPYNDKPVISYGVILHTDIHCLIVCRKYTPSFIHIIRGSYRMADIQTLLSNITRGELVTLLYLNISEFPALYDTVFYWQKDDAQRQYAITRFQESIQSIAFYCSKININTLNTEPEWVFPKGRPLHFEEPKHCAIRELEEEVGIKCNIDGDHMITEVRKGTNDRVYECRYFIIKLENTIITDQIGPEISTKLWVTLEDGKKLLDAKRYEMLESIMKQSSTNLR